MMTDRYGDGWDGAKLYVEFPDGSQGKTTILFVFLSFSLSSLSLSLFLSLLLIQNN